MRYKNIAGRFFGLVINHACDRQTDRQTDRQNYDSRDRAIALRRRAVKRLSLRVYCKGRTHRLTLSADTTVSVGRQCWPVCHEFKPFQICPHSPVFSESLSGIVFPLSRGSARTVRNLRIMSYLIFWTAPVNVCCSKG